MGENTINWKTVNRKLKFERCWRKIKKLIKKLVSWIKKTVKAVGRWISKNKEYLVMAGPLVAATVAKLSRMYMTHREDVIRERRFYDPRFGRYSTARRRLRPRELRVVDERYAAGESYRSILDDLGLLK